MRIEIAKILKPQGIKGELKVLPLSLPGYLEGAREVYLGEKPAKLVKGQIREGFGYIMLDCCADRNTAETLRDLIISVEADDLEELGEEEYYFMDLVGCMVSNELGEELGEVVEVENYGAADIINIHLGYTTIAVPFLREVFVSVDVKKKKIVVDSKKFLEVTDYEN